MHQSDHVSLNCVFYICIEYNVILFLVLYNTNDIHQLTVIVSCYESCVVLLCNIILLGLLVYRF